MVIFWSKVLLDHGADVNVQNRGRGLAQARGCHSADFFIRRAPCRSADCPYLGDAEERNLASTTQLCSNGVALYGKPQAAGITIG